MTQNAFRVRPAAIRWLIAFTFTVILVALLFECIRGFGGSSFISNVAAADDGDWTYVDHDFSRKT